MRVVTWILRILSIATFSYMCWIVYNQLSGYWDWSAPYSFIVTVFRLLSLLLLLVALLILTGFLQMLVGSPTANELVTGIFNSTILHFWYLQPYGTAGPFVDVYQMFNTFLLDLNTLSTELIDELFTFLYFAFAGIGIVLFLQSLFRMEHKFVGGAFISIQAILFLAAFRGLPILGSNPPLTDFVPFLLSDMQILVLVSFAYLEISYQMIYSYSVGKPVETRAEMLKKQLLALRSAVRRQEAIERGEKVTAATMSRSTGATAFSFLREVIERKLLGSKEALENLDTISDVRRLNIFVDKLFATEPNTQEELTASAAAPSATYIISSTIIGSVIRFLGVVALSFLLVNPSWFVDLLNFPPGIKNSVEIQQPEIVVLLLVPVLLLFAFVAAIITWLSKEEEKEPELTKEEKKVLKRKRKEIQRKRKETERARKKQQREARRRAVETEKDEWDRALEEIYKS